MLKSLQFNSIKKLFFLASTYLFVGTLPLFLSINTIALWIFILCSLLFLNIKERSKRLWERRRFVLPVVLLFSMYIISLLLSDNLKDALKDLTRVITLLILPLIVLSHNKEDFNVKHIYIALGVGLFIGMVICWVTVIISILTNATPLRQAPYFFEWIYSNWNLVKPLDVHPSYFGLLIVIFIFALIKNKEFKFLRDQKIKLLIVLAPYFLFLFELSSRIVLISFILILLLLVLQKINLKKILLIGFFLIGLVFVSIKFDYLGNKFTRLVDVEGNVKVERFQRWNYIIEEFNKTENFIFGTGSGDTEIVYNAAYLEGHFQEALVDNYNAHNQFLEYYVSNGIVGLFCFCLVLFTFLRKTKLKEDALTFFVIIILLSLVESYFSRAKGVFIFSFFYGFYLLIYGTRQVKKA